MASDDIQAEAVNGGDHGLGYQGCLKPQMLILRVLLKLFLHSRPNPFTHLSRSRIGKGHYQQLVNIQWMVTLAYHPDDTLHQDRCLAAAGCSGHQKVPVPAVNYLLLFFSPFYCHRSPLPPPGIFAPRYPQA